MKSIPSLILLTILFINSHCTPQNKLGNMLNDDGPVAFPGAEGFGKYTTGGRGGKVYIVTNLKDDGEGSFRAAAVKKENRVIVFAVSGTIHLNSKLNIAGNCTIAGQSAPGDGICFADAPVVLAGNNIIVRFVRFRMGDKNQKGGMVDGNGADDAFGGTKRKNIIIDHCSMSWSTDEVFSVYNGDSTTLQWNLIAEPLNYSYHFETGDADYEKHGYGGIWGGRHLSAHHNLFAHCKNRTPRFDGIRNIDEENVDFRNNVIYNWGDNNVYAGEGGTYNIVNNYYKYGPSTKATVKFRIANPYKIDGKIPFGKFYVNGNYVDGSPENTQANWKGVDMEKGKPDDKLAAQITQPLAFMNVTTQTATEAYLYILNNVGVTAPIRDTLDARIINDVKNRTGRFIDVQGGYAHGTAYETTLNAWPLLKQGNVLKDTDQDGMPDDWEIAHQLNPNNAADASYTSTSQHYTNIEIYLNSLVK
ncbi:polysaccharide lyase family 1 protein [Ferruginibacter yonginensis]|uniref:Polysaccharide lyase family 1 protein n=1 Tax=Ferruginibacter yonginensis TaxID=1310416 RepID=A0ABV8QNY3_9BACT